jgi:polar amino acid transport system ATP-binding protein
MLKIIKLSKNYGNTTVLKNINISIKEKQILGIAGASGSGKSTLLRCIQKLENIDCGKIICDQKTGFMFQDFQLFPHMTVLQNLVYSPNINNIRGNTEKNAINILTKIGVGNRIDAYPCQLSGGQKQRVALARSLMMQPSILLCDEPTSGLDIPTIQDVVSLLRSVGKMGITMIIASHNLDFLIQVSDNIILLKDGIIVIDINLRKTKSPIEFLKQYY